MVHDNRTNPTRESTSPVLLRAYHTALEEAVIPTSSVAARQGQFGKRWVQSFRQTLTTDQNAIYLYVTNTSESQLNAEFLDLYTNGDVLIDIYDEPDLDSSTFTKRDFRNVRSDVTKDPPWDAYIGTENNVTVNDEGRPFTHTFVQSGQTTVGQSLDKPGYIIDDDSSALLKITNNNGNDILVAATIYFHEEVYSRDLTKLDGTN